LKFKIKNIKS